MFQEHTLNELTSELERILDPPSARSHEDDDEDDLLPDSEVRLAPRRTYAPYAMLLSCRAYRTFNYLQDDSDIRDLERVRDGMILVDPKHRIASVTCKNSFLILFMKQPQA